MSSSLVEQEILVGQQNLAELYDGFHSNARLPIGVIATALACNEKYVASSLAVTIQSMRLYPNAHAGQITRAAGDPEFAADRFLLGRTHAEAINEHPSIRTVSAADEAALLKVRVAAVKLVAQQLEITPAAVLRPRHAPDAYSSSDRYNSDQRAQIKPLALAKNEELARASHASDDYYNLEVATADHLHIERIMEATGMGSELIEDALQKSGLVPERRFDETTKRAGTYLSKAATAELLRFLAAAKAEAARNRNN